MTAKNPEPPIRDSEVYSVRAYRAIRRSVSDSAFRFSEGRNCYRTCPVITDLTRRLFDRLLNTGRLTEYGSVRDQPEHRLVARLLSTYLEWPSLTEDHLLFVAGAQEGISLVYSWAGRAGLANVLPLPAYYSFEQSALRWGVEIAAHVSVSGDAHGSFEHSVLDVRIIPNAITGTVFPPSPLPRPAAFTLVDAVYQTGEHDDPGTLRSALLSALATSAPERTALVMTASKDLALPRLRAAVLATQNDSLLQFARGDRLERVAVINPLQMQIMAYYLALLIVRERRVTGCRRIPDVAAGFRAAGLDWLSDDEVEQVLSHWASMAAHTSANLERLVASDAGLAVRIRPMAGYSVLADFDPPFDDADAYLRWCHHAGVHHGLRLNPSLVLAGSPSDWEALYPGRSLLRINVSNDVEPFDSALGRLAAACRGREDL